MSDLNTLQKPSTGPSSAPQTTPGVQLDTGSSKEQITSITNVERAPEVASTQARGGTPSAGGKKATRKESQTTTTDKKQPQKLPETEEEFRKVLNIEIKKRIDELLKKAKQLQQQPTPENLRDLANTVGEARRLNITMKSLWQYTLEKLKKIYSTLFT